MKNAFNECSRSANLLLIIFQRFQLGLSGGTHNPLSFVLAPWPPQFNLWYLNVQTFSY